MAGNPETEETTENKMAAPEDENKMAVEQDGGEKKTTIGSETPV